MKFKRLAMFGLVGIMLMMLGQTVFAFGDTSGDPNEQKINALKEKGILSGTGNDSFNPQGKLDYASGISMIVKGLELNIDNIRFIKEPKVSDYFTGLKDGSWYEQAFIVGQLNGLDIPKDVKANDPMTREQFAHHLFQAMSKKGDFAFIDLYAVLNDEAEVNPAYMNSVQKLLISHIAKLDDEGKFHPKAPVTRSEAAGWLHDVIEKVNENELTPPEERNMPLKDLKLNVAPLNDKVNEVTITAMAPHPGYGIRIASISFDNGKAVVAVETVLPEPGKMYPQVVTEVRAVTYIDAALQVSLADAGGISDSAPGDGGTVSR